jgi:hypothetical protein
MLILSTGRMRLSSRVDPNVEPKPRLHGRSVTIFDRPTRESTVVAEIRLSNASHRRPGLTYDPSRWY